MQIGYIGLGKMGKNMALRLIEKGHEVVVWNRSPKPRNELAKAGAIATKTIEELVKSLSTPRVIWLMLPAGEVTDVVLDQLQIVLDTGDTLINGANEHYKNTKRHAMLLAEKGIQFLDAGVSGGPTGARNGACVMVGGEKGTFEKLKPLFNDISAPNAYQFFQGHGAGHFVKMVHNGIEYGMMQSIAEGFDLLKHSDFNFNLKHIAAIYNNQSVIESRLLGWMECGFEAFGNDLEGVSGSARSGGSAGMEKSAAKWTLDVARELDTSAKVIQDAINARIKSQEKPTFQGKIINALRNQFGNHSIN